MPSTEPVRRSARFTRIIRRIATVGLPALMMLMVAGFFGLRWAESIITFHPEGYAPGPAWALPSNGEDVWMKTADGVRLHGWFIKASARPAAATVIYFHGNGGNISNVGWVGRSLAGRGLDVLLFDYRGYGRSEGSVADEQALNRDADAAYDYITRERGVSPDHLALYGASLGTTMAIDQASRKACAALVIESGLSSASDLASALLPWLPRWAHRFGRNRFESAHKLASIHCPVFVIHGEPDDRIPTEQGRALFARANQPKRLLILPGAGHNVIGSGGETYLVTIADFISEALHNGAQPPTPAQAPPLRKTPASQAVQTRF